MPNTIGLEPVLRWSITSRTTLQDGLYRYDAIGRLQDTPPAGAHEVKLPEISDYLTLGPLGTAFFGRPYQAEGSETCYPRVLLIDEIDKSDIDMPNDLLHLFEEGEFEIPELGRLESGKYQQNEQSGKKGFRIKPPTMTTRLPFSIKPNSSSRPTAGSAALRRRSPWSS